MTNNIQGNSQKVNSWFLSRNSTSQKGMGWYTSSDEREDLTAKITLPSKDLIQIWWRNQKLYWQAKAKRIQHHQTSSTTNAKGTSLSGKHKRRKGPTKTNQWASLVAQWLRVCLPMQGTGVRALVWEDPTCRGATGPVSHNCWACASGARAPQQERPR